MGYAEAETILNGPIEAVCDCLNEIEHTPEWVIGQGLMSGKQLMG
jgi:hypothetical protein